MSKKRFISNTTKKSSLSRVVTFVLIWQNWYSQELFLLELWV